MRIVVESFKRLYAKKRLTKADIRKRVESGFINREEYVYITGEIYPDTNA